MIPLSTQPKVTTTYTVDLNKTIKEIIQLNNARSW